MSLKSFGRSFEKKLLRPFLYGTRRWFGIASTSDRMTTLEDRIERLENLFREQAGLHYLRLAEPPPGADPRRDSA